MAVVRYKWDIKWSGLSKHSVIVSCYNQYCYSFVFFLSLIMKIRKGKRMKQSDIQYLSRFEKAMGLKIVDNSYSSAYKLPLPSTH